MFGVATCPEVKSLSSFYATVQAWMPEKVRDDNRAGMIIRWTEACRRPG